jgi:hypothetical protein
MAVLLETFLPPLYVKVRLKVMPKVLSKKRNGAAQTSPYAQAAAKTTAANNIFKMNTDMGQHVLKNPGVAQAIVDKADLKQSDVRSSPERWRAGFYMADTH